MPLVMDGVKEVRRDEYHWYVARAVSSGTSLVVVIPAAIARHLGLKPGDAVEVAIRRATEEAIREHGGVYGRWAASRAGRRRASRWRRARCPKCGREGTVVVSWNGRYVYVRHGRGDECYVGPVEAVGERVPELKGIVERLLRGER